MRGTGRQRPNAPELDVVFRALEDQLCREIITELDEPMTVAELSETCDVPLSTTYRKVDRLEEASLVTERTEIRRGGHHRSLYQVNFVTLVVVLSQGQSIELEIERPRSNPEEGLVSLWSELRRET